MYKWQQVKALKAQGISIKKTARRLKLSKNTVRKYLRSAEPPCFKSREYEKLLDHYITPVNEMLEKQYIGTRIYNELLQMGYTGSLSSVHRYVADIRKVAQLKAKATTRVETAPGKQMQYDWKEWNLAIGGTPVKIYIHEVVLSYSRKKHYVSSLSITTVDIIRAIAAATEFFGGAAEELLIDNPKQMVITHKKSGTIRYNDEFLRFCGLYGIQPSACRTYRARTKGKAERPFYYVQEHLLRGLEVRELNEFDRLLEEFTVTYNARAHSDLKESPDDRFEREKDTLKRIPSVEPALLYNRAVRTVSNDGYIGWDGELYPVAMGYCLQSVRVEAEFGKTIKVYEMGGSLIAEHKARLVDKGIRPVHPEHEERNEVYRKKKESYRAKSVRVFIETFGQTGQIYAEGLKTSVTANMYWHIEEIIEYTKLYSIADVSSVLAECIEIGAYHKNSVRRLLGCRAPQSSPPEILNEPYMPSPVDIKRPLCAYKVEVAS
ncbi:MAG: IS21 family transposase [Puia sp.]|nr:IS21 family transposase [Puia sp.]